ncbi:MAG: bifunctional precorrin-2 dehydrogenase/sirohydrochlorin ferrochelatase [Phycisphaerae bacterium]|nr:bifunctional precorrin-2 dehydrogenase/sirohydrochlorin ferrochelatase [Phycisphaerae bacterium]
MRTFPVMLNLNDRLAVVVGAGPVAMRKVRALRQAGARVRLVSPDAPRETSDGVTVVAETYQPNHLDGAFVVFACTNNRELNSRVASDARNRGLLVCAVDQPEDCDFFSPAVARDGNVVVAVGTGGSAPFLARRLAEQFQTALPEHIGAFAECLAAIREELQTTNLPVERRRDILRELASEKTYRAFRAEGPSAVRRISDTLTRAQGDPPCDSCA